MVCKLLIFPFLKKIMVNQWFLVVTLLFSVNVGVVVNGFGPNTCGSTANITKGKRRQRAGSVEYICFSKVFTHDT